MSWNMLVNSFSPTVWILAVSSVLALPVWNMLVNSFSPTVWILAVSSVLALPVGTGHP
jgi:hypothetical protein